MTPYYMGDFDTYSKLFRQHSLRVVELMRILDEQLVNEQMTSIRPRDLYKMVNDMMYAVDDSYKKEMGIKDNSESYIFPYMSKDEVWAEMRTMLQQELARYLDDKNK